MYKCIVSSLLHPKKFHLQILLFLSGVTVVVGCGINFLVPIYLQKIVDSLALPTPRGQHKDFPWDLVVILVSFKTIQGVGALSLITGLQQILWLPLEQHMRHLVQVKFLSHIHAMSLNWMMSQKLGDIMGALDRGIDGIASTVEHLLYSIFPTLADIVLALAYLSFKFGSPYALIVSGQIALYVVFTTYMVEKRSRHQNSLNRADDSLRQTAMQSVLNYETVKIFGNERFEQEKYDHGLLLLNRQKFRIGVMTSCIDMFQQAILCLGLLACSLLLLSTISNHHQKVRSGMNLLTPGDYVLCTAYMAQIYGSLNYLAGYYRELRVNVINAQAMRKYLAQSSEIKDSPHACPLQIKAGAVEFKNVTLANDEGNVILRDISFVVEPKTTLALVGDTGSGKTSVARLLLRIFETSSGQILIDGVNVKSVTLKSLHQSVGIIPQDTSLFHDSIRNNICYGKLGASDPEVIHAARRAQIHDRIISFPEGYDTIVGERGTRLSGGERQRIAISRAILQDSKILILDEASAALDVHTERCIQNEILNNFCKSRTCLMITHNLMSTVNADCIIVLKDGQIVEKGSYAALVNENGHFSTMWKNQLHHAREQA